MRKASLQLSYIPVGVLMHVVTEKIFLVKPKILDDPNGLYCFPLRLITPRGFLVLVSHSLKVMSLEK